MLKRARGRAEARLRTIQERRGLRATWRNRLWGKQGHMLPTLETVLDYETRHRRQMARTLRLLQELRA